MSEAVRIDVWHRVTSSLSTADLELLLNRLSADERVRAARLASNHDRRDFVAAHSLVRDALSALVDRSPADWRFEIDSFGKPNVAPDQITPPGIICSLSHTRGLVACAVAAANGALGIDVEEISTSPDLRAIAARFFSVGEVEMLDALDRPDYAVRFTELWTLKEAYFKATGVGLAEPSATASFGFEGAANLSFVSEAAADSPDWAFALAIPTPGYRLALAIRHRDGRAPTIRWHSPDSAPAVVVRRT